MATTPKTPPLPASLLTPRRVVGNLSAPRQRRLSVHRIVVWFVPFSLTAEDLDMSDCDIEGDLNYGRD